MRRTVSSRLRISMAMTPHLVAGRLEQKGNATPRANMRRSGPSERILSPIRFRYSGVGMVGPWCSTPQEAADAFDQMWRERVPS
jgi:hypothetical protein